MGMAAIGVALWKYVMQYSPENPNYFNRDRFVLSNGEFSEIIPLAGREEKAETDKENPGHCCLWQYTFMHLVGYKNMTLDQLKSYHSTRTDSICPGHPEIEHEGIEVTTGPLGQGIANAVGMAMATKNLGATYNKPQFPLVNNKTFCMVGDACLQEGVALEAISLAGHFRLNNLIVVYDNNQVTCDGSVDLTNTEDVNTKMVACGWKVIDVMDGNHDVEGIVSALVEARASEDKPVFINVRTVIGIGSKVAGDAKAHGAAFGADDVANIKKNSGFDPEQHFFVPQEVYDYFQDVRSRGREHERAWAELVASYGKEYPDLAKEFGYRVRGEFPAEDWASIIPKKEDLPTTPTASRKSAGLVCNPLAAKLSNFMVGTADLSPSVNMIWKDKVDFQHPDLRTTCGINGDYTGRYVHWGIREHAMASISNGLAAFNKGTILPVTSSFFMFYIVSVFSPILTHQIFSRFSLTDIQFSFSTPHQVYVWVLSSAYKPSTSPPTTASAPAKTAPPTNPLSSRPSTAPCPICCTCGPATARKSRERFWLPCPPGTPPALFPCRDKTWSNTLNTRPATACSRARTLLSKTPMHKSP